MFQGTPDNTVTDWQYQDMSPGTLDAYEESSSAKIQIGISSGADAGDVVIGEPGLELVLGALRALEHWSDCS